MRIVSSTRSARGVGRTQPRGEEPLGALPHQHEIDAAGGAVAQRRIGGVEQVDRSQPAVQVEPLAQVELRRHLDAARPAHAGQPHGPQQDGVELGQAVESRWQAADRRCAGTRPRPRENSSYSKATPRAHRAHRAPARPPPPRPDRSRRRAAARSSNSWTPSQFSNGSGRREISVLVGRRVSLPPEAKAGLSRSDGELNAFARGADAPATCAIVKNHGWRHLIAGGLLNQCPKKQNTLRPARSR